MLHFMNQLLALRSDRRGVTALEYGLIAAAIIVAISSTVFSLGGSLNSTFASITSSL